MEQFGGKPGARKTIDTQLGKFESDELQSITEADIAEGDRVFLYTESGNRYMLRHSRSRGGRLIMYNEREGNFSPESGHPFLVKTPAIAAVGKPFEYFSITDEQNNKGSPGNSRK